jgi:hypothetical protein
MLSWGEVRKCNSVSLLTGVKSAKANNNMSHSLSFMVKVRIGFKKFANLSDDPNQLGGERLSPGADNDRIN